MKNSIKKCKTQTQNNNNNKKKRQKNIFVVAPRGTLPDVWCFWHRSLVDNFWWNKFRCAVFAVLSLIRCDHQCIAEITDSDLIIMGVSHKDVVRLRKYDTISLLYFITLILHDYLPNVENKVAIVLSSLWLHCYLVFTLMSRCMMFRLWR